MLLAQERGGKMSDIQLYNYLHWLKERGQIFAPMNEALAEEESSAVAVDIAEEAQPLTLLAFLSSSPLQAEEHDMLTKIAQALGLESDGYEIRESAARASEAQQHLVYLCLEERAHDTQSATGHWRLSIPHPRLMLKEPFLKREAWDKLQKIKTAIP